MGKIIISGASGAFGRAAAELLLEKVAPQDAILLTRTPAKLADLAARGADVRFADFDDPASLPAAMAGGERMLLISTARVGTRVGQHRNAVEAAVAAGVRHIVYTSIIAADAPGNPAIVKNDHRATEEIIEASGAAWTHLRDSQYAEAIAGPMTIPALMFGGKPDNCGDGPVAFVSRDDCVATAVGVLTQPGHENKAYVLTGDLIDGKAASAMRLVNESVPLDRLKARTTEVAEMLLKKNPVALKFAKDAVRRVGTMTYDEAEDYLVRMQEAANFHDKSEGRKEGIRQFIDEKSYKPGLGSYDLSKAKTSA